MIPRSWNYPAYRRIGTVPAMKDQHRKITQQNEKYPMISQPLEMGFLWRRRLNKLMAAKQNATDIKCQRLSV